MRLVALLALLLQAIAVPVEATPVATLQWGTCPNTSGGNRGPGSTTETMTITATGLTGSVRSFRVEIQMYAGGSQIPDAWRFDGAGCNREGLTLNQGLAGNACPLLRGSHLLEVSKVEYEAWPHGGWSDARQTLVYEVIFDAVTVDPSKTYTLARFDVDFGNCGCLERPLCISMPRSMSYVDANAQEHAFWVQNFSLNWNDPGDWLACGGVPCDLSPNPCVFGDDTLCVATPARAETWGGIKASYR